MKIKSKNIVVIIALTICGYLLYPIIKYSDPIENITTSNVNEDIAQNNNIEEKQSAKNNLSNLSNYAKSIYNELTPISKEDLKASWKDEFGCYSASESDDMDCKNSFLTASSYEEALWMQRQGYPNSTQLKLLDNKENFKYLIELGENNRFTPALAILSVYALKTGDKNGQNISLSLRAYSDHHQTFPHRIRGEILLAKNDLFFGLSSLKSAELLGDYEARYIFNRYLHKHPSVALDAADHATMYLGKVNIMSNQFKQDPRPESNNGG